MFDKAKSSRVSWPIVPSRAHPAGVGAPRRGALVSGLMLVLLAPFLLASGETPDAEQTEEAATASETPVPNMNAEDYRLYRQYTNALRDPRVQAMPEAQRMRRIARNFQVPLSRLREVARLGEEIGEGQVERQQETVRAALEDGALKGRINSVEFVDSRGIVVAYVGWRTTEQERLVPEAALIAKTVADTAPVAELVALWACMGRRKVFTARIQTSSASQFSLRRIDEFAETRYIRLFEEVRNRFKGDPPEDDIGCG